MSKTAARYLCGVPESECIGAIGGLKHSPAQRDLKSHSSRLEAFNCYKKHLLGQGYTQIGSREFRKEGQPVRVLTKKSRFGYRMRPGKEGRVMPENPNIIIF